MPRKDVSAIFKSTYAIDVESKNGIDTLIKNLGLQSLADLLNLLGMQHHAVAEALKGVATDYMTAKLATRDAARKVREAERLREKLKKLEGEQP